MGKKNLLLILAVLFCLTPVFSQECLKYLRMEEPDESMKGKNRLLVGLVQVEEIMRGFGLPDFSGTIEFADSQTGQPFATLAKIDKGKMKWSHKLANEKTMLVEFNKEDHPAILAKVKEKSARPGFQLQIIDAKSGQISAKCECSFLALPDLVAAIQYPVKLSPGQALGNELSVKIENQGTAAAGEFDVDVVLSSDDQIPVKPGAGSGNFAEDGLLPNGRERVAALEPGQSVNLTFKGAVAIPADTPPGKFHIGAVVDSGNVVAEIDEGNNVDRGVLMVAVPRPKSLAVELPDTELSLEIPQYTFKIQCGGVILSDGKDWKMCRMKPNVYHFQHVNWKDFHWEVNTVDRTVWEIRGAQFCKRGGNEKDMKIRVEVKGGSITVPPSRIVLKLAKTEIAYNPEARKFNLLTYGYPIDYIPFWRICNLEPHVYQFRYILWTSFFWEADIYRGELREMTGTDFCKAGGSAKKLDLKVRVEK